MEKEIEKYISRHNYLIRKIFLDIRKTILDSNQLIQEKIWANMPTYYINSAFIRLIAFTDHVNIMFSKGLELTETQSIYPLTNKGMIQIFTVDTVDLDLIKKLVRLNFELGEH